MFLKTNLFLKVPGYQTMFVFLNFLYNQQHLYVSEYQYDMFLNLKVILNFPIHQHNFHVPECLCDEDAPANKNYLNATDYSRISVFLN